MRLKDRCFSNDIEVVLYSRGQCDEQICRVYVHLVDLERHRVGFEGSFVIVFSFLYKGPNVPTYMRLEATAHTVLYQSYACFTLAEVNHHEAFHAHGFCDNPDGKHGRVMNNELTPMLRIFLEDLVSEFPPS